MNIKWDDIVNDREYKQTSVPELQRLRVAKIRADDQGDPVALPVLYFYWYLYPVAAIVLSGGFIVSILLRIVSFSNHRPRLERYRLSH